MRRSDDLAGHNDDTADSGTSAGASPATATSAGAAAAAASPAAQTPGSLKVQVKMGSPPAASPSKVCRIEGVGHTNMTLVLPVFSLHPVIVVDAGSVGLPLCLQFDVAVLYFKKGLTQMLALIPSVSVLRCISRLFFSVPQAARDKDSTHDAWVPVDCCVVLYLRTVAQHGQHARALAIAFVVFSAYTCTAHWSWPTQCLGFNASLVPDCEQFT